MQDHREKQSKKFKNLPEEWRSEAMSKSNEECFHDITKAAMNVIALKAAEAQDEDLAMLKEQVKTASAVYKEGAATNNLKIEFLVENLKSRGVEVPSVSDFLRAAANGERE